MPRNGDGGEDGGREKAAGLSSLPDVVATQPTSPSPVPPSSESQPQQQQQQHRQQLLSPMGPTASEPATSPTGFRPTTTKRPKPLAPWSAASYERLNPTSPGLGPASPALGHAQLPPPPPYPSPSEPPSPAYSSASHAPLNSQFHQAGAGGIQAPSSPYFSPHSHGLGVGIGGNGTEWVPMVRPVGLGPVAEARTERRRRLRPLVFCCVPLLLLLVALIVGLVYGVVRVSDKNTTY